MALKELNINDVIIVCDTRMSKDMLAFGLGSGALSRGLTVHYAGVMPTPALIYNSYNKNCIGIMITASHNPYTDNGIKVLNKGIKSRLKVCIDYANGATSSAFVNIKFTNAIY